MLRIGQFNRLAVSKEVDFGFYLDSGDDRWGEILLPRNQAPGGCAAGDQLDVFLHFDSEDRIIATTRRPHAMVGQFALLRVASMEKVGAFMDWGLPKDLLVPFGEQKLRLQASRSYIVHVFIDEGTGRIVGSTRINKFLDRIPADYEAGQQVELLIARETELGYLAIINDAHWGFLYHSEIFQDLRIGARVNGYIRKMRDDGKIDLSLTPPGYEKVAGIAETILHQLARNNGFLPITARTTPEELAERFGVSKKNYKKAIGSLYKKRLLSIDPDGIRLLPPPAGEGKPGGAPEPTG